MYANNAEGKFLKVRPATWAAMNQLRPPGLSWDLFLASMLPVMRVEAQRLAEERARVLRLPANLLAKQSSTTGE